ncbi:hypothetical protein LINGRAPRIM_LOCUS982 [Linum grandiflorum]
MGSLDTLEVKHV